MRKIALVALLATITLVPIARAGTPESGFADTAAATSLNHPTALAFLPDGTFVVTEQPGDLVLVNGGTQTTLGAIDVCYDGGEMGLLGAAIDPNFTSNGFIYLYRTNGTATCGGGPGRVNEVVRVTKTGNSIGSLTVLLTGMRTDGGNHNGGVLRIGPDGKLYVGVGDTGNGDNHLPIGSSTNPYAGDVGSLEGKILRLNLDGSIPSDNPFVSTVGARGEVFAYGFRNPFRMSFEPTTNALWVGDVGDLTVEEVDIVTPGGNYGWPACEGDLPTVACAMPGFTAPIFTYDHSGSGSLGGCLIGGAFGGTAMGAFAGEYFFGDCDTSNVYHATLNGTHDGIVGTGVLASGNAGTPADFVPGPNGEIYYAANTDGDIRKLVAANAGVEALISGKMLSLRANPTSPTRKTVSFSSKDPSITLGAGNGTADDPTISGATLRVVGGSFDDTYNLPASGWQYMFKPGQGKGYKYKDSAQANGPIKTASIKPGKFLKASGKGMALGHTLATDPQPVSLVFSSGPKPYCMSFGGTIKFKVDRSFSAKDAPAPASCP